MIAAINQWFDDSMHRQAARGKWSYVMRVGLLAWSIPLLCAINWWFYRWTQYSPLTVFLFSLAFGLPAGILMGLASYKNALRTPEERREWRLQQVRRGAASFAWRHGVLGFGIPMFLAFSVLIVLTLRSYPDRLVVFVAADCLLFGTVFGVGLWAVHEKNCQ
jgi:hypothetical protein